MTPVLEGFALGFAYAAPIGAQNVYVIQSASGGPLRMSVRVALAVTAMDITLALACLYGLGAVLEWFPWLSPAMTVAGCAYLLWIGVNLARSRAEQDADGKTGQGATHSYAWSRVAVAAFTLTWFNPQAILDGTLLLGGFRAQLGDGEVPLFIIGMAAASAVWFHALTALVGSCRNRFGPRAMMWINRVCGVALCALGLRLGLGLL
ncbi:LysE/ArgO family amino acid transporter [Streptomyces sp. NPDC020607]|uniref:LysE/ArgO family amino acid transporter n=1 Tax=Streptomyces sp. NPDC020607 TaxID=3365082 RepID=UPI0037AA72F2